MKRKILSILTCLMLCLTSVFMLSGCKKEKEPVPVAEAVAMESFNKAMTNLESEDAIKMVCYVPEMGETIIITSQEKMYTCVPQTSEMWMTKNGDVFQVYSIENTSITDTPNYQYTKSIVPAVEQDSDSEDIADSISGLFGDMSDLFDGMEFAFSNASELDGVLTINFGLKFEGETIYSMTFKIENDKLTSISMRMFGMSITYSIQYGEQYLQEIPAIPNHNWVELKPYIDVTFEDSTITEPIEFAVKEQLNLDDFNLLFYQDELAWSYEEYDLTIDMIQGFDTETVTEPGQPRTLTITFCGLTYEIEYTVVAAPVAE